MSSGGSRHGSECEHGGLRQKCRVCELEAEVDELKRLRIADNKNYGLELRDPYGTIWQEVKRLQDDLAARERELEEACEHLRLAVMTRHYHEAGEIYKDACRACGRDLRDDIHYRSGQSLAGDRRLAEAFLARRTTTNKET